MDRLEDNMEFFQLFPEDGMRDLIALDNRGDEVFYRFPEHGMPDTEWHPPRLAWCPDHDEEEFQTPDLAILDHFLVINRRALSALRPLLESAGNFLECYSQDDDLTILNITVALEASEKGVWTSSAFIHASNVNGSDVSSASNEPFLEPQLFRLKGSSLGFIYATRAFRDVICAEGFRGITFCRVGAD